MNEDQLDPIIDKKPYQRVAICYSVALAIQLTAIIVIQFGFITIIVSFDLFNFLPLPCLSLLAYISTLIGLSQSCRRLFLPHIFIESVVAIFYFTMAIMCIKDFVMRDTNDESTVFHPVHVGRALKFGIFLLVGVPFQLLFILVIFKRYYLGSF